MVSPDIRKANLTDEYKMLITFENGEEKIFDLKPYLGYPVFKALINKEELCAFEIVDGTIEWKCGADLSVDTFYLDSVPVNIYNVAKLS